MTQLPLTFDLSVLDTTFWAIDTGNLAGGDATKTCAELQGKFQTSGFFLGTLPRGTFRRNAGFALAIAGCSKDSDPANAALNGRVCGVGWDAAKGNLAAAAMALDTSTPVQGGSLGAQFINLASASISIPSFKDGVVPAFFIPSPTTTLRIGSGNAAYGAPLTPVPAAVATFPGLMNGGAYIVAYAPALWAGGTPTTPPDPTKGAIPVPFSTVELASTGDPAQVGKYLLAGHAYLFALVGDPLSSASSGRNPKIQIIAIPMKR